MGSLDTLMFKDLFLAALLIPLTFSIAAACSCVSSNTGCNQAWKSGEVIFLGTATAKVSIETPAPAEYFMSERFAFHFSVTESFRGPAIPGEDFVVYTGSGYPFAIGTSYLVYASTFKDELTTSICTPTSPEVMVAAVLRQLRTIQIGESVDDLFGTIGTAPKGVGFADRVETKPLADITVSVINRSGVERSTTTDPKGVYSFQSLPSDTYQVEVDLPSGMSTWQRNKGDKITVEVGTKGLSGCRVDLFARANGRISGTIVDDAGTGVPGFVTIKPADPKEAEAASRRGGLPGYTTEDGNFTLELLPPGRYRLRFNPKIDGQVNLGVPPVWSDVIELGFGQQIENLHFNVSTTRDKAKAGAANNRTNNLYPQITPITQIQYKDKK
jgi:hypothetical protein